MATSTKKVLIAGSGIMGRGIAAAFASSNVEAAILSRNPDKVRGMPNNITILGEFPEIKPDLIIETIPEVLGTKLEFNERVEKFYDGDVILASNTSSLGLQEMANELRHPGQYCGIHYFHPAEVVPVVELARVSQTRNETIEISRRLLEKTRKYVILIREPIEGLLVNRLQHAIMHEAYFLIERGVCTAKDVDEVAKMLLGPRMSVTGLIEQKDLSGLDTHALAQRALCPHLDHSVTAHNIVQAKFTSGNLGAKTGLGFYDWRDFDVANYRNETSTLLSNILQILDVSRPIAPPQVDGDSN